MPHPTPAPDGTTSPLQDPDWQKQITVLIKTFERPELLARSIASIRRFYPDLRIAVADDSRRPQPPKDVDLFLPLPYDVGVSAGRNALLDRIETPYLLLSDDDNEFTADTRLEAMRDLLLTTPFNLVAGRRRDIFRGVFEQKNRMLYILKNAHRGMLDGHPRFEFVHNFFLAPTDIVRAVRWNDALKLCEHIDFFLRGTSRFIATEIDVRFAHHHGLNRPRQPWEGIRRRITRTHQRMAAHSIGFSRRIECTFPSLTEVPKGTWSGPPPS